MRGKALDALLACGALICRPDSQMRKPRVPKRDPKQAQRQPERSPSFYEGNPSFARWGQAIRPLC
jgi:hypothetical protein